MNTQDILRHGRDIFDAELDYSEYYDYNLLEEILGKVDIILDYSEYYDYELTDPEFQCFDVALDSSEIYDFDLTNNVIDI